MATRPSNLKVLLIAPKPPKELPSLPWIDAEIQAIVNSGLNVHMERDVNERRLLELLVVPRAFDMIWFASHGSSEGVYLSDGIVPTDALAAILRGSGAHYVVLNTCDSIHVAAIISEETSADVICTISTVEDRQAWRTAALFASNLARGKSVYVAFQQARPTLPGKYIYLPGFNGFEDRRELRARMDQLTEALVSGPPEKVDQIISSIAVLTGRVEEVENRTTIVERKLNPPKAAILLLAASFLVVIFGGFLAITAINSPSIRFVIQQQPAMAAIGAFFLVALAVTWALAGIALLRNSVNERQP